MMDDPEVGRSGREVILLCVSSELYICMCKYIHHITLLDVVIDVARCLPGNMPSNVLGTVIYQVM